MIDMSPLPEAWTYVGLTLIFIMLFIIIRWGLFEFIPGEKK